MICVILDVIIISCGLFWFVKIMGLIWRPPKHCRDCGRRQDCTFTLNRIGDIACGDYIRKPKQRRCKDCKKIKLKYWHVFYCGTKFTDDGYDTYLTDKKTGDHIRVHANSWGTTPFNCEHYTRKWWKLWRSK